MSRQPLFAETDRRPRRGRKYFDLDEANRALVYVGRVVDDITTTYAQAVDLRRRIEHGRGVSVRDVLHTQYEQAMDRLNLLIDELHQIGVELKDFERGLIDFPAVHDGREIYLCWQRGELEVNSWHEVDAGYASRQDVAMLLKARPRYSEAA